ncbi:uncharacterized protein LOC125682051 [Ostrea edulis]|uniref:uncharacterized protein LOC125682051 n=1 Tax=Ostrea edulis TaxID=37623 RepID=UPI0024AECF76|nr:uncharacterized protein LOC125682051 [Ostrea edulis]
MKNSLEHLLASSVLVLCLSCAFTNGISQTQNSIVQLSKLFSKLHDIQDTKQSQAESSKDQIRSDTRKQRGEIGVILALGAPVNMETLGEEKVLEDKQTDLSNRGWDIDFDDAEQEVEKRQGAWDYDYGLGGGRFGKRFDYSFGGGRFGRDINHVKQEDIN